MIPGAIFHGHQIPILSSIKLAALPEHELHGAPPPPPPCYVTISRQAGAGGRTLAEALVQRLNAFDPGEVPWTAWDRELIERVADDLHVSAKLVDELEEKSRLWLGDLFAGLSGSSQEQADELRIYRRVVVTIRGLAQAGRAVIVGRGGAFITAPIAGGVHVRLVAPLEHRIRHMTELYHLSHDEAVRKVADIDRNRQAFYRRYWPREMLRPERFTATFNTAELDDSQIAESLVPLVLRRSKAMHGSEVAEQRREYKEPRESPNTPEVQFKETKHV